MVPLLLSQGALRCGDYIKELLQGGTEEAAELEHTQVETGQIQRKMMRVELTEEEEPSVAFEGRIITARE